MSGPAEQSDASWAAWEAQDLEPLPEQATILAETVEQLLTSHDERDRQIIVLYLQGHETVEVSSQVGCTQRTVQRVLERLRGRLQRLSAEDESA